MQVYVVTPLQGCFVDKKCKLNGKVGHDREAEQEEKNAGPNPTLRRVPFFRLRPFSDYEHFQTNEKPPAKASRR